MNPCLYILFLFVFTTRFTCTYLIATTKAGSFRATAAAGLGLLALAGINTVVAFTPPGVFPVNTENVTNFFDASTLATNGVNVAKANTTIAPTVALDKVINGTTFALVMFDPDTPATGIGGNGTNSFLHWFQDGLTSSRASTKVGGVNGKTVFNLVNVSPPGPPEGETHRYTQILMDTTGLKTFNVSRQAFDADNFVKAADVKVITSNFFNVTGV